MLLPFYDELLSDLLGYRGSLREPRGSSLRHLAYEPVALPRGEPPVHLLLARSADGGGRRGRAEPSRRPAQSASQRSLVRPVAEKEARKRIWRKKTKTSLHCLRVAFTTPTG